MSGKFITLEGIDGAGKSTQLDTIQHWLEVRGVVVRRTREPGGTALAEALRPLLLNTPMSPLSEALLVFAGRHDHVTQVIEPALARGEWVLSDRFVDASFAYQGGGRGLSQDILKTLETWVCADFQPDLTLWFDLDPDIAAQRLARARQEGDRFEREERAFFERVRAGYEARSHLPRVYRIDAAVEPRTLAEQVDGVLRRAFPSLAGSP
ncbi:dTMP kinase [Ferrovum myxofaciens]|jgi:dTMP kinase|uniref:Thymidylate kinase n=1 Tax=Ferrovum myxofaciens TaxID=416213 RepID=A0A859A6W3_9PROT|nr:dTMP kinase [Ferrovum myxofaciens]NDU89915.1 dTMP kinase [Ferrovum sp.]KXW59278.1 thymidylate kinase [Ferrovum myxofaciens]MBU6993656.1 dTMP kinase [Ferrovum myxofaciens]QKE37640.1 MAG: dTMP kinase [Ferrovum myxofaciens]QWY75298.1 MAG: dTMP kinase [Ferrovum myxofaciens]